MIVRQLKRQELDEALSMVWKVFCDYEAVDYPEEGKRAFWDAIHDEEYLNGLKAYEAFDGESMVGIMATRNAGAHVALFFVEGAYHRKGIGRALWNAVLADSIHGKISVHSSLYAVEVYKKLGFEPLGDIMESGGIKYVPMAFTRV